jgi:hypothetical protein
VRVGVGWGCTRLRKKTRDAHVFVWSAHQSMCENHLHSIVSISLTLKKHQILNLMFNNFIILDLVSNSKFYFSIYLKMWISIAALLKLFFCLSCEAIEMNIDLTCKHFAPATRKEEEEQEQEGDEATTAKDEEVQAQQQQQDASD